MKLAAIQMCSSHNVDDNLATAGRLIAQAAAHDAKLVVLPEMFALMGTDQKDKVLIKETYGDGNIQRFLAETARKNRIWIVGGTIPIVCDDDDKVRASCLVFNNDGIVVARYDKMHLFDVIVSETEVYKESATTQPGKDVVVVDTPIGRLGLAVCYDIRFPGLFRALMQKGVEVIAIPSAFTVPTGEAHWTLLARSRAVDTLSYVVGACQGGMHTSGRKTYGHSLMVDPWGRIIAQQPNVEPGVIYATVDLESLHKIRTSLPIYQHPCTQVNQK